METYCQECGNLVTRDESPSVWVHAADLIGIDEAYDLDEHHVARPEIEQ